MFAYELLANHSAENPRGFLTPEVFESFFSYTRDADNKLVFTYGHERIPDNVRISAPLQFPNPSISSKKWCEINLGHEDLVLYLLVLQR